MKRARPYGTHPDVPDHRDRKYEAPRHIRRVLPRAVDLRPLCPPVEDRRPLNACSAYAIGAAIWFDEKRQGQGPPPSSPLFLYWVERARAHTIGTNAPVSLRDGYKAAARHGICSERLWPWKPERFADRPTKACFREAKKSRAVEYHRVVRDLDNLRGCLAEGFPFTLGLSVHESFESRAVRETGRVPMPKRGEKTLGGHAVLVVGYEERCRRFLVRNSWGTRWGQRGYFTLPWNYLLNPDLAWDFWTVRRVI
ncbi:MAG TPA: C1 family peptidase [Thermoanaerobaculia bacterium]|nr:C1 family peptidase [Thermoanaerobaculia bacterium]